MTIGSLHIVEFLIVVLCLAVVTHLGHRAATKGSQALEKAVFRSLPVRQCT